MKGNQRNMPDVWKMPATLFTADYLLGRRFEFKKLKDIPITPDITCVAFDTVQQRVRVHALDGGRWWIPFADFRRALTIGILVESATGGPFTL